MIALTVTCRPQWQPWLLHQLAKQEIDYHLIVFDDCSSPLRWYGVKRAVVRPEGRSKLSLGEKRQLVLAEAAKHNEPFAWFDDDDWHPKERLAVAAALLVPPPSMMADVVGFNQGLFCDVKTLQTRRLEIAERVVFNSAVFAPHCAKHAFLPMNRGEDTSWLHSVLKDSTVVSSPIMQHCWMSHEGNVTGKRGSMTFESPRFARFDSWELQFLKGLK